MNHNIAIENLAPIRFIARWMLGIIFGMAGFWKVFTLGSANHANQFFVQGFAEHWIPEWLLLMLGHIIPYWELAGGILLLIGFKVRWVLISFGLLLLITTYGHALQQPLFDIDGHTFTRLILIFIVLAIADEHDWLSVDKPTR